MISERFGEMLGEQVLPVERWHPYPTAVERDGWDGLPNSIRASLVTEGEGCLGYAWPFLPATGIMEFVRGGDRLRFENLYIRRRTALTALVLAECAEGKGRFLDEIVNGLWGICEETSWSLPAHLNSPTRSGGLPDPARPVVDLFAAGPAALNWRASVRGSRSVRHPAGCGQWATWPARYTRFLTPGPTPRRRQRPPCCAMRGCR